MRSFSILFGLLLTGCPALVEGDPIPKDQFYQPGSLAQKGDSLFVSNTNSDRQYKTGSVLELNSDTGSILNFIEVPSLAGELSFNPNQSTLLLASRDHGRITSILDGEVTPLSLNSSPYFIRFFDDNTSGVLGYLSIATFEEWPEDKLSLVGDQSGFDYFEFNSSRVEIKHRFTVSNCLKSSDDGFRQMAKISGIQITDDEVSILAEYFIKPATAPTRNVFLLQTTKSALASGKLDNTNCQALNLSDKTGGAARSRALAVSSKTAYALLDASPMVAKINLTTGNLDKISISCQQPTNLKLSPDNQFLAVSCGKNNWVSLYDTQSLTLLSTFQGNRFNGGLGPVDILFDISGPKRFFVSFQTDHRVGVFEYDTPNCNRSMCFSKWLELPR